MSKSIGETRYFDISIYSAHYSTVISRLYEVSVRKPRCNWVELYETTANDVVPLSYHI